jgi:hypothetical protein
MRNKKLKADKTNGLRRREKEELCLPAGGGGLIAKFGCHLVDCIADPERDALGKDGEALAHGSAGGVHLAKRPEESMGQRG